jgi:DNA-binding NtrC family response regulator
VRIVAATHRDLRQSIAEGRFREDLYYRLSMVEVEVPSLAEHRDDIPLLAQHFIAHFAREYGKPLRGFSPAAKAALEHHSWPGNVRELENALGRACMMAAGELIEAGDLPSRVLQPQNDTSQTQTSNGPDSKGLAAHERQMIVQALAQAQGNQSHAARHLGIGRDALRYKMKKYGIG